jgi:hypothetical protein
MPAVAYHARRYNRHNPLASWNPIMHTRMLLSLSLVAILTTPLGALPPAPPPPAEYDVIIRYRIDAARTERIVQFRALVQYLESIGFKKDPSENENEEEDRTATEMTGHISSTNVRKILAESHIRTIMLFSKGVKAPEADQLVRVDLELTAGLRHDLQQQLYDQTRSVLRDLGFQEAVGYDNHANTRIVGNILSKRLLNLLQDLRETPAGAKQGAPFRSVTPIRLVEVLPERELVKPLPERAALPANQAKLAPDLRAMLADKEEAAKARRLEVVLLTTPLVTDRRWEEPLRPAAPGFLVEGQLGPLVTMLVPADRAAALADLPNVSAVRLPRAARLRLKPGGDGKDTLKALGLDRLHSLGHRGRGTRIAVIDDDFQGYADMVKAGRLPAATRVVDLTTARNGDLTPDPFPTTSGLGHGTRCALAAVLAAPEANLTLVRVDPAAPYQVQEAARFINGEAFVPPSLDQRASDLAAESRDLSDRRERLQMERAILLNGSLPFEEFEIKWADYKKRLEAFTKEELAHDQRTRRYLDLREALNGLKGVHVVASSLVWNEGQPVDGSGALSRYFDDTPFKGALWFQAAGDTKGQSWAGAFRDADGNGVMEFAAPGTPLPKGHWTTELNFLGWSNGAASADLPAGAKVRVTLQWREAHDPDFLAHGEDVYGAPLANLRLLILRQRDPAGSKLPADDMEVVAQSERLPQRIENTPTAATYEYVVAFTVPTAGRYALMVLGRAPASTRPADRITSPSAQRAGELRPRIFVDTLGGKGKAVFADFTSDSGSGGREEGGLGTPADAHAVVTVGSASDDGGAATYSPPGPAFNLRLLPKPDVLVADRLLLPGGESERGTNLAASFAAGTAATAFSAGASRSKFAEAMHASPGQVLRVPANWPNHGR